ncbi:MAG: tetratricopeptide repeat protein [Chromatiales bacterium]|nr:MAG: tetratricopeptide repeat protein [Chromatiales bacterium]
MSILLLVGMQAPALEQTTQVMAIRDGIDQAVLTGDGEALAGYAEQLKGAEGDWVDYYRAYVDYRSSQIAGTKKKQAKALLNSCIETLNGLVKRRPDLAEAHALHATCYGNSAQFYMLRAAARGSSSNKALKQALKLSSGNPRVLLQDAQSLVFRPAIFGGDKEKAMKRLKLAVEVFPNWQSPDPEAPVWGEAEAWLTIGWLHREAGAVDRAREAFNKALSIAPDYQAAKDELNDPG